MWKLYLHTMLWHIIPCFVCQYHIFMNLVLTLCLFLAIVLWFHMLLGIANSSLSSSYYNAFFLLTFPPFSSWNGDLLDMCLMKVTPIANIIWRIISFIIIWSISNLKHWIEHPLNARNMIWEYEWWLWTFGCKMCWDDGHNFGCAISSSHYHIYRAKASKIQEL